MKVKEAITTPRAPGRPRSERARQDILESAYKLLKKKGISAVTAQEIADGAGVSTATLYRWWDTKEAIMFDACFEYVKPALSIGEKGSPLARLREFIVRGAVWLGSEDARVMARLVTGIYGDKKLQQMYQVLINLVMNGVDAMRSLTHRPRELLIKSAKNHNEVFIEVQDSGEGLDSKQAERIFQPFFTTKPEGVGMGLAISRSIVESHGGRLWAESVSKGAVFQFTLPIK